MDVPLNWSNGLIFCVDKFYFIVFDLIFLCLGCRMPVQKLAAALRQLVFALSSAVDNICASRTQQPVTVAALPRVHVAHGVTLQRKNSLDLYGISSQQRVTDGVNQMDSSPIAVEKPVTKKIEQPSSAIGTS